VSAPRPGRGAAAGPPPATYGAAVASLQERGRFGVRLGLARTRALLAALGHPERGIRGALIGGTNGKGSVVALAGSCLRAAGYRAGEMPKPHLVSYRERLRIGGRPIEPAVFTRLVTDALPIADRVARRHGDPTEFELLTALALAWFEHEAVDLALVEVGLGGRLDATHAWDGGVAAITNVDLDHTQWLGDTVEAIAREKAAIVMRGDRAVTGASGAALGPLRRRARRVGVDLVEVGVPPVLAMDRDGIVVDLPRLGPSRIGLLGRHQAANVAVADAVLDALEEAGIAVVGPAARRAGYAAARWPGRFELVRVETADGPRDVLLDGAHNPAGARALAAAIDELGAGLASDGAPSGPATLILAAMADKDVAGIIAALVESPLLREARVIATQVAGQRAMGAPDLGAAWAAAVPRAAAVALPDPGTAIESALAETTGPIVVAGSLYLVGAVRERLVDDPDLRDPA
jgi:dihydrofolate synthase / folylpolyglutamate synthase